MSFTSAEIFSITQVPDCPISLKTAKLQDLSQFLFYLGYNFGLAVKKKEPFVAMP